MKKLLQSLQPLLFGICLVLGFIETVQHGWVEMAIFILGTFFAMLFLLYAGQFIWQHICRCKEHRSFP